MQIIVTPNDRVIVILDPDAAAYGAKKCGRNAYRAGGIHVRMRHGPFGQTVHLDQGATLDLAEDGTAQLLIIAE
jgi:hypothetical protein